MEILKILFMAIARERYLGRCLLIFAVFIATLLSIGVASAMAEDTMEYPVKGAYLFKFGSFVEWPQNSFPEATTPFVIGILGEDPFGASLDDSVQNRTIQGRPIVVKRYKNVEQAKGAHILYISATEADRLEQILASLRNMSILTVSDESKRAIAIINFTIQDNKVRFEIDADAANRAGLKVSSRLLSVAKVVDSEKRGTKK